MRRQILSLGFIVLVGLVIAGCVQTQDPVGPADNAAATIPIYAAFEWSDDGVPCGDSLTVNLIAGQNINIGNALVILEDGTLCIEINTVNNWVMTLTHVAIAPVVDSLPQTGSGNPKVGKFFFSTEHEPPVTSYTYCCNPLDFIWEPGGICIAIHADVMLLDENSDPIQEETAWAEGPEFPGNSWATYVTYDVNSCSGGDESLIIVTYPNGGEDVCMDYPLLISWDYLGESPEYVFIELLLDGIPCMTIADSVPNTGSYEWVAQQCDGVPEGYKIRITELGCGSIDESDNTFQIIQCGGGEKR